MAEFVLNRLLDESAQPEVGMSNLNEYWNRGELDYYYTKSGVDLLSLEEKPEEAESFLYVLLTDTKTGFSKLSKFLTKQPYNHVSLALDDSFNRVYAYSITNGNGLRGGIMIENHDDLKGSRYSLYRIAVTNDVYNQVVDYVEELANNNIKTSYNWLGLFNAVFNTELFKNEDGQRRICSEFVMEVFRGCGIELLKGRVSSTVKPYDLIKSKLLKFVRRGIVK